MTDGQALNVVYLLAATLLFVSVLGSMLSARFGMPLLLIFLGVGMLAGEEGVIGIPYQNFFLTNLLGQQALAVILLDGGLRTSLHSFRLALRPAAVLASWGVLATVLLLGLFIAWILQLDWRLALLMAAIVGSTDAAAVFSLLRHGGVRLNERVQATLEIESGANDPMAILLVTGLIALNLNPEQAALSAFAWLLLQQLGLGLLLGLGAGWLLAAILPRLRLAEGMYAILIFSGGTMSFALTNLLGGSGFLAIYLAGVVIGNRKTRATEHVLQVMDGMAWMSQVVLFVVLGLLVTPSEVLQLGWAALAIALFLIFVARPLAVFSGLFFFGYHWREMGFISWVGLRGAVPVTLALLPIMQGVPQARMLFDLSFAVVILSLLVQGMSLPRMARLFRVRVPTHYEPEDSHEIWVGNRASIHVYEYVVRKGAFAVGRNAQDIARRVDAEALTVFALVRDGVIQPPASSLRGGDRVWYSARLPQQGDALAKIFNDTVAERREQSAFFGEWIVSPQVIMGELALLDEAGLSAEERALTVVAFVEANLNVAPVVGDTVAVGEDWLLVVRETQADGRILALGLKEQKSSENQ